MKLHIHRQALTAPVIPMLHPTLRHRVLVYGVGVLALVSISLWTMSQAHADQATADQQVATLRMTAAASQAAALKQWSMADNELVSKAVSLVDTPHRDVAILMLNEAVRRDPENRDAALELGYTYLAAGDLTKAKVSLEHARSLDPIYPVTYQLLEQLYVKIGDKQASDQAAVRAKDFAKVPELTK